MATSVVLEDEAVDYGRLANNFIQVQSLQSALSRSEMNVGLIPKLVLRIINEGCWEEWIVPETSAVVSWRNPKTGRVNPADFREFIRTERPRGCGCPVYVFERMIWDTPAWAAFQGLLVGKPGRPVDESTPRNDAGQFTAHIRNNITDMESGPDTIPVSPEAPIPRVRDYSREARTGTSISYTIRRLQRQAPELAEQVLRGDLTPHAAAVKAGFHEVKVTVPRDNPGRAARILVRHLDPPRVKELIVELSRAAGFRTETD